MPELPEVETIKRQLDEKLKGLKIAKIEVLNKKSFIGEAKEIKGKIVCGVGRRAKITLIELSNGVYLAIHLKLTGQLIYREKSGKEKTLVEENSGPFAIKELPNKFTRVIITFDNNGKLYFNDLRMFGWIKVVREIGEIAKEKLGPEAIDETAFSLDYFHQVLAKSRKPIKLVIMDQTKIAGVGNIYANEALFSAGILPSRPANSLSDKEAEKLRGAIIAVLNEAIRQKGTSDKDEAFRQISGKKGNFQKFLAVYGRAGQACPNCGKIIKRIALGGRGTFFCPACQR